MHNISIYLHKIVTVLGYQIGSFNISCGNLDKAFRKDISVLTDSHSLLLQCLLKFTESLTSQASNQKLWCHFSIVFLLSEEGHKISGQVMTVDGNTERMS